MLHMRSQRLTAPRVANIQNCIHLDNMLQSLAWGAGGASWDADIRKLSWQESIAASLHSTF